MDRSVPEDEKVTSDQMIISTVNDQMLARLKEIGTP